MQVMKLHGEYGFEAVVLTDTDTLWLRHPSSYFAQHPSAHVLTTTDCNSYEADIYLLPFHHRCATSTVESSDFER